MGGVHVCDAYLQFSSTTLSLRDQTQGYQVWQPLFLPAKPTYRPYFLLASSSLYIVETDFQLTSQVLGLQVCPHTWSHEVVEAETSD